jgi:hypothetical protein
MPALRVCLAAIALSLALAVPAEAQRMASDLVKDLRDAQIQRQLIAAGSLDAVVGRATRRDLRTAIERFRKAHGFKTGGPLTGDERAKLAEIYGKFEKVTGLKEHSHTDPASKHTLRLRLPLALVKAAFVESMGEQTDKWVEYRADDNSVSIGPEIYSLSRFTPIALFRERIMGASLKYKHLHLTSDEFTALGEAGGAQDGFFSYNLVLTYGDQLKGLFMRYTKRPPAGFKAPDFLLPMVEAEAPPGTETADPAARAWQLLLQSVTNLVASDFPFDNGWKAVSSKACPVNHDTADGAPKHLRILFATDRAMKSATPPEGAVANPDSLFGPEPAGRLHLGCAYVPLPYAGGDASKLIADYHLIHKTEKGDLGDRIYLTDEIGEGIDLAGRGDALIFIHGYYVAFKDALSTVAKIVSDTGYEGRVYMYSWPSAQALLSYIQDLDNSEQAEPFLQSFMRMLMRDANITKIDVLAHSMGSQSLLRAVSALRPIFETQRGEGEWARPIRIGQVIFAAPDVAVPVFDQKVHRIAPYADRVTVYVSSTDSALLASKLLRGGIPRTGDLPGGEPILIDIDKVHVIDATGKESWWRLDRILFSGGYGHDYFSQAEGVLDDIQDILKGRRADDRTTPDQRDSARFEKVPYKAMPGHFFWRLKK